MAEKEFNLLHEPWILVMKPGGQTEEVSMLEAFRHAHKWRGLAGELPTQDVAVLRLLLAVLHAVFARYDIDGSYVPLESPSEALMRWGTLWERGEFPQEIITEYLMLYEDRFWLFHPTQPFYQVMVKKPQNSSLEETGMTQENAQLTPEKKDSEEGIKATPKKASFLIGDVAESENSVPLFLSRTQRDHLLFGEAARWLLHTNAFDVAPSGAPAKKGTTIKGYGVAWLGGLGVVWATGSTLFETLMLNFVISTRHETWARCSVIWENEGHDSGQNLLETKPSFPRNPGELLTMQFRRIQLLRNSEQDRVIGFLLWSGQSIDGANAFLEPMTTWKTVKSVKNGRPEHTPRRHNAEHQIWRDLSALLPTARGPGTGVTPPPGVVDFIAWLREEGVISIPYIQLNSAGVVYKQNTAFKDVFSDALRFNLELLALLDKAWVSRIVSEVAYADGLVKHIGTLAESLIRAAISVDESNPRNPAVVHKSISMEQAYSRLDSPFRLWLQGINPVNDELDLVCHQWRDLARPIILNFGKELVAQAGIKAYVGRPETSREEYRKKDGKSRRAFSAPEAYNDFLRSIYSQN